MTIASAVRAVLPRLVEFCARQRILVIAMAALLSAACVYAAAHRLGVTTDTTLLFSNSLPWKQTSRALSRAFPQNDGVLVAVIDAKIPEEAEATAAALAGRLRARPDLFHNVVQPDTSDYLQRNAFLLIGSTELQDLLDRTVDAQPFLGQLVADPSLRGLFGALSLVAEGAKRGVSAGAMGPAMVQFHTALSQAADGHAVPLSWDRTCWPVPWPSRPAATVSSPSNRCVISARSSLAARRPPSCARPRPTCLTSPRTRPACG